MNKLAVIATLTVVALVPQIAEAQRPLAKTSDWTMTDQELYAFPTRTLTKLALGLKGMEGSLKPKQAMEALALLKAVSKNVGAILDNPQFSEAKKKQEIVLAQNKGASQMIRVLGPDAMAFKKAFKGLEGRAFETKLKSVLGARFASFQSKLLRADHLGGNAGPFKT